MTARRTALVLAAAVAVAVVGAVAARRAALRPLPEPRTGAFPNGMEYAAVGGGPRTLLFIQGGPGSSVPSRSALRMMAGSIRPYLDDGFTVWLVTRRRGMPPGHTIADMAEDYAEVIADELGGRVDLVVGESLGGEIAQYLAANHSDRMGRLALVCTAARSTEWGDDVDRRLAEAFGAGRTAEAGATFLEYVIAGQRWRWLRRLLGPLVGRWIAGQGYPVQDVVTESLAEAGFDARPALPRITVPVLLVCGDEDVFFAKDAVEETARLIPDCTLVWYEGRGHIRAASSRSVPRDVLAFAHRTSTSPTAP
jgi:pimeloyl-ACP methyl ester carboxylesterase